MIQDWSNITVGALQNLWQGFIDFIPKLIGSILVFVVGWFVAVWIGKLVAEILKRLKFDKIFEKTKWDKALEKADIKVKMSGFIGGLVKWILVIVFLLAAVQILGLSEFAGILKGLVDYLPNIVVAVAIFVVAAILADFAEKLMKAVVGKMHVKHVNLIGSVVRWAIWILAGFTILSQLGVAEDIIKTLMQGFVGLIVISAALAFGLGGKDVAREILEEARAKIKG